MISVHYHGSENHAPWTNADGGAGDLFTERAGTVRAQRLTDEIARFNEEARKSNRSMFETLMPLDMWLWSHGFSKDFFHSALVPMLTPLFVTQHGNAAQSAGGTLNHFNPETGFLSFNASDMEGSAPVFHTVGGVQFMYERMMVEAAASTPGLRTYTSTPVTEVSPSKDGWKVGLLNGTYHEYDEIILATNAHIGERLLSAGGDGDVDQWPWCSDAPEGKLTCRHWYDGLFRALRKWTMRNTEYQMAEVTLSRSAQDDPVRGDSLYHIFDGGVMAGSIDRILHLQSPNSTGGDYRLRVAPVGGTSVAADTTPILARREWEHHHFNLWEHLLVFRVLPHFNNFDGVHVAGDWTQSVGQDAAVRSGIRAACAVGLSNVTKAALRSVGIDPADVNAC